MDEVYHMSIHVVAKGSDTFTVTVTDERGSKKYRVTVNENSYNRFSIGGESRESLIERSFEFLLDRESKESILSSFDITVISRYFPEYEKMITRE